MSLVCFWKRNWVIKVICGFLLFVESQLFSMLARLVRSNKLLHLGKICFFSTGSAFAQRLENWNRLFPSYTAAESGELVVNMQVRYNS